MKLLLLSTLLLAITLLLGTSGCSKKQEDAPAPMPTTASNTGSYKLDGQLVTCSKVVAYEYPNRGGMGADELQIQLLTPATTQGPGENMLLSFTRSVGDPVSAYGYMRVTHITWPSGQGTSPQTRSFNNNGQFTLAATASGGYSGTFSCTSPAFGTGSASAITEGIFTDVHP